MGTHAEMTEQKGCKKGAKKGVKRGQKGAKRRHAMRQKGGKKGAKRGKRGRRRTMEQSMTSKSLEHIIASNPSYVALTLVA